LLVFLVVLLFIVFLTLTPNKRNQEASNGGATVNLAPVPLSLTSKLYFLQPGSIMAGRRLYPYSVIPGGVRSAQELRNAIDYDPVVAAHYAGFNVARTRAMRLDRDRTVYVSYRLGNNVFWTKRPLRLLKGETLVTDGEHEARTRCGNRVSEAPAAPVTSEEPSPEAFQTLNDPDMVSNARLDLPLTPPPTTDIVPPKDGKFFIPPVVPIPWGGGSSSPPTPTPSPANTPEPGTILLLSTGLAAIWVRGRTRKR
jgi:hypothetical protein